MATSRGVQGSKLKSVNNIPGFKTFLHLKAVLRKNNEFRHSVGKWRDDEINVNCLFSEP